jgi:hypothetical protein
MRFWRKKPEPAFSGNCLVRMYTGDGHSVGKCWHSTYDGVCPSHGDVTQYLQNYGWPRDFELPKYDGTAWAERLREQWKGK